MADRSINDFVDIIEMNNSVLHYCIVSLQNEMLLRAKSGFIFAPMNFNIPQFGDVIPDKLVAQTVCHSFESSLKNFLDAAVNLSQM